MQVSCKPTPCLLLAQRWGEEISDQSLQFGKGVAFDGPDLNFITSSLLGDRLCTVVKEITCFTMQTMRQAIRDDQIRGRAPLYPLSLGRLPRWDLTANQ